MSISEVHFGSKYITKQNNLTCKTVNQSKMTLPRNIKYRRYCILPKTFAPRAASVINEKTLCIMFKHFLGCCVISKIKINSTWNLALKYRNSMFNYFKPLFFLPGPYDLTHYIFKWANVLQLMICTQ
jgi:hypothetical protein